MIWGYLYLNIINPITRFKVYFAFIERLLCCRFLKMGQTWKEL